MSCLAITCEFNRREEKWKVEAIKCVLEAHEFTYLLSNRVSMNEIIFKKRKNVSINITTISYYRIDICMSGGRGGLQTKVDVV